MIRRVALAAVVVALAGVASLSGCATPCCYCYCGEVPTQNLLDVNASVGVTRPEVTPDGKIVAAAVRY